MEKTNWDKRMDILFDIMNNENDIFLSDANGIALRVSESYEEHYKVRAEDIVGKSCYELEDDGTFVPSVTAMVLRERKKVTTLQKNKLGESVLTTGVPVFDSEGNLEYVISFNSIDIAGLSSLNEQYKVLEQMISEYKKQILSMKLHKSDDEKLITKSKQMQDIYSLIAQISDVDVNVLITGNTGVGKTLIAHIIHQHSHRAKGPFVTIDCGAIPPSLLESELFGYEKGAFTGADSKGKAGQVELANGGTLFLDEIGVLPIELQVKLLSVIQNKSFSRVGGLDQVNVDFRMIAATNQNLEQSVEEGKFREDLYYRLNVVSINIPPLRERKDDIVPLIMKFLLDFNLRYHKNVTISSEALMMMEAYQWPGNIRQLENFIERLVVTNTNEVVRPEDLPGNIRYGGPKEYDKAGYLSDVLERVEKDIIIEAYNKYHTSVAVANALGLSQTTAARKLRKYVPGYAQKE